MRVFVTGATGFIGNHLCRRLVERGDDVIALVRSRAKASSLPSGIETIQGDLSIFSDPKTVLPMCDVVIHLAGVVAAERLEDYDIVNNAAVSDLVECLRRQIWKPRRLLFASSLAAAGPSPPGVPWTEADAPTPIDAYGRAKASAELVVRDAPFPTTSFRPPIVFGPGDTATLTLFRAARAGVGMRVSGPVQRLSFVDVRDLADAILLMADDRREESFVYFTSHPRSIDVVELWREPGMAVGKDVLVLPVPPQVLFTAMWSSTWLAKIFRFKNQLDKKQYDQMVATAFVCSSERLREDLGFRPKHDLADALSNAAEGYLAAELIAARRR